MKTATRWSRLVTPWLVLGATSVCPAQVVLSGSSYFQNFDSLGSGLPDGWTVRTGASVNSTGSAWSVRPRDETSWATNTEEFRDVGSAQSLPSGTSVDAQRGSTNHALGVRQGGSFATDPGASFQFSFDASAVSINSLSIELQMLDVETRSTTWSIQWSQNGGTAWTTLNSWADPGIFGVTAYTFAAADLAGMNGQSSVLFRVAALSASTGSDSRDTIAIDNFSLNYSPTSIPEPATAAALAGVTALVGAIGRRWRRHAPS